MKKIIEFIKNLFKNKCYRDGIYIGSNDNFRQLFLKAEEQIKLNNKPEALNIIKMMQMYMITQGDSTAIKKLLSAI